MRSAFLILGSLAVLGVAFGLYFWLQPPSAPLSVRNPSTQPAPGAPRPSATGNAIGPGEREWVEQYDKTGEVTSRFRAAEHTPEQDHIRVTKPEAEFFLNGGRVLRMHGDHGIIVLPQDSVRKSQGLAMSQTGMPSRGELKDVTIDLFETEQAKVPLLTLTLDNIAFDTELYRIYTEAAEIDGKRVARDRIPVQVRGADYDFDGQGVVIALNERDRRLELLEIAHGEKLIVKNPAALNDASKPAAPKPPPGNQVPPSPPSPLPAPRPSPIAGNPKAASRPAEKPPIIYRASFQENVRVVQGQAELAEGTEMQVDFAVEGKKSAKPAPAGAAAAAPLPTDTPRTPAPASAPASASAPAAAPSEPVIIYWTGKLRVTPSGDAGLPPGDQIVRMFGAPVRVHQRGGEIQGEVLAYRTAEAILTVRGSDQFPMVMTDGQGGKATGQSLEYRRNQRTALFSGAGSFVGTAKNAAQTQAAWTKLARLHFIGEHEDSMALEKAEFAGDVKINDPRVNLTTQSLVLDFESVPKAPAKAPANADAGFLGGKEQTESVLKHLTANGDVHGQTVESSGKIQWIDGQHLEILTARTNDGGFYAQNLVADGAVSASDGQQGIAAEHLVATLSPAAKASDAKSGQWVKTDVTDLLATGNVNVHSKDGGTATADRMQVTGDSITLTGQPARVKSKGTEVAGPVLVVRPDLEQYRVDGKGMMHFEQKDVKKATTRPTDVAFDKGVIVDGKTNVAEVTGNVTVESLTSNGTLTKTSSQRVRLLLADKPTTQPAKAKSTATGIAAMGDKMDGFKNKDLVEVQFLDDAHLVAVRPDAQGNLAEQFDLLAPTIRYNAQSQELTVPTAGRMDLVDRRTTNKSSQSKGITAIKWSKQLLYDQLAGRAVIDGDVFVRNEPDDPKRQAFEMKSQHVTVEMDKTQAKRGDDARVGFSKLIAEENVECTLKNLTMVVPYLQYDPVTDIVIARGTDQQRGIYDDGSTGRGSFRSLRYNRKTDEILMEDAQSNSAR